MVLKFIEHFLWIASAMLHAGEDTGMWDEQDGFFYDVLRLPDWSGGSEVSGGPHWRDYLPFYEYFHGDNRARIGANHQTGWTGTIARTMHLFATLKPELLLEEDGRAAFEKQVQAQSEQPGGTVHRGGR